MASFLLDLTKTYVEKLIDGAILESRYICCYTSIAADFEKEKETLEAERTAVKQKVNVAKRGGEDILRNVTSWQEQADKLMQEDTKTKLTCFIQWCPNCKQRYKRGKELEIKTREIRQLITKSDTFEVVGIAHNLPGVEYYSSQYYISFKSRKVKYKDLLDALSDDNNYIIGLQGMGGTGKTTLAKQVGKELHQSKQFDLVIDTTVSYTPDIKKIQDEIAGPLGLTSLKDCGESERPKRLWSRLTNGEKILLILDDVWGDINLEEIGVPCRDNHKGCRVLVTTRNQWVCNSLGCEKTIQLELLSEEDAWNLFKEHAGITDGVSKRLLEKGREIVKECKGLPVAIAAIAGSLKGYQHKEEWDAALKSLKKPMPMHGVDESLIEVYKCLRYSYDNLKNEKAKDIFLLCSMLPEDYEISVETLTRLSVAAGHFGEVEGKYDESRSEVAVAKNKLIDSCLLLEAGDKKVKMHDLVRDVALWIAKKRIQAVNLSNKNHKSMVEREKDTEYLFCEGKGKDVFSCRVISSKLTLLYVELDDDEDGDRDNPLEIPNSFFENMTRLQVFHLSSYYSWVKNLALSLPQSFMSLSSIRSLILKRVILGDISILKNLQILETLEFIYCTLAALPHEISELGNLRLLNLHGCEFGRNDPFKVIERCKSLEELYFVDAYGSKAIIGSENHEKIALPTLERYCICQAFANDEDKYSSVSKYVGLEEIDVCFCEATFKYLVKIAETLWLRRMKGTWKNLMPDIISMDEGMTDLVELILESCSQMKCLIDINDINPHVLNVFPKVVALKLVEMENFEELCKGSIPFDLLKSVERLEIKRCKDLQGRLFKSKMSLCNLKTMKLDKCQKLQSLFQVLTSRSLVVLEELIIEDCENLKNIIVTDEGQEDEIVDGDNDDNIKSRGSMFPKLRSICIRKCPQLEFILSFLSYAQGLPLLEVIEISECGQLKYIFGQHQHDEHDEGKGLHDHDVKEVILGSLREISLRVLPKFIDIFEECNDPMCCSERRLSSRDDSKSKSTTNNRKIFTWSNLSCCYYGSRSTTTSTATEITPAVSNSNDQLQDHYSISLASKNSTNLQYAECLSRQWRMMCNIKKITISGVAKLKYLFILSVAPTTLLESLIVERCDELKQIIAVDSSDGNDSKWSNVFPKLQVLTVRKCRELEYVIGEYPPHPDNDNDHDSNNTQIHIQLFPALTTLQFDDLPKVMGIWSSTSSYRTTLPLLREVRLWECPQFSIKSIKDLNGGNNFVALKGLYVKDCKAENIACLGDQQQMDSRLSEIRLRSLPDMKYLFMGPKNSLLTLGNLWWLTIERCEKLEVIFSDCVARCLPLLQRLEIRECKELKQIVEEEEDYVETCLFPKLTHLMVEKCNKLKCVFPVSTSSKELPKLKYLIIRDALELEQVFLRSEEHKKVELPNLKLAVLIELPSLICPGIEFELQTHLFLHKCPKLISPTSSITLTTLEELKQLAQECEMDGFSKAPIAKPIEVEATLGHELSSSSLVNSNSIEKVPGLDIPLHKANSNDVSASSHSHETFKSVLAIPETYFSGPIIKEHFSNDDNNVEVLEDYKSKTPNIIKENLVTEIAEDSPIKPEEGSKSIIRNTSPKPIPASSQKDNKRNIEEVATTNVEIITSSTHSKSVSPKHKTYPQDNIEEVTAANVKITEFSTHSKSASSSAGPLYSQEYVDVKHSHGDSKLVATIAEMHAPVSLNDVDASESHSVPFEESNKLSPTIPSLIASQPPIPFEDNSLSNNEIENPVTETIIKVGNKVQVAPQHELTSSLVNPTIEEDSKSKIKSISPTLLLAPLQKDDKRNMEEINIKNVKIITSSTLLESTSSSAGPLVSSEHKTLVNVNSNDGGNDQVATSSSPIITSSEHVVTEDAIGDRDSHQISPECEMDDFSKAPIIKTIEDLQVGLEVQATSGPKLSFSPRKTNSHGNKINTEEGTTSTNSKTVTSPNETLAPESKSSPTIQSHVASQTPSIPSKGNASQIVEDSSFASLVKRELEQLVSNSHLAYENLPLLTDFLVKHPSVHLIDNAHSNKYKGFAYSCLVEFLKFLQTHSVLDVLGSSHSKFMELLQDVRGFAFDKDWLDDVERRALHPSLQVSQDALQNILESKQQATKEVEELNLKIHILLQHVEDLKHQLASSKTALENIVQDEAQILEAWATLSAPLFY